MNVKFRYFLYIMLAFVLCFSFRMKSYAAIEFDVTNGIPNHGNGYSVNQYIIRDNDNEHKFAIRFQQSGTAPDGTQTGSVYLYSNFSGTVLIDNYYTSYYPDGTQANHISQTISVTFSRVGTDNVFVSNQVFQNHVTGGNIFVFNSYEQVKAYIEEGVLPQLPYDGDLNLDSFKVSYYVWSSTLTSPHYRFNVTWSNPNIYQVQVKVYSTRASQSWEGQSSPFSNTFIGSSFAQVNGDVVHCVATPYKQDGTYGNSLYYSFTFNGNDPLTNVWRKYNNNPYQNNIIDIPYTGVSGNEVVQAPVDGITQNYNYKVNYNPVTNEYGDLILNEIYYSPVVIYEDNTPSEVVEQTQTYITNNYTTNNYYDATNNIDYDYDFDFGDVSGSDIQNGYNGVGDFFNGFGTFIGKLANLLSGLFPFLSPAVATWLIAGVAFILALGVIMIFIKIVGAVKDLIPFL